MLLSPGSTARSAMRPEVTAGPMERNLSPANVAALNLDSGLVADFPADFAADFASDFASDFVSDFSAGFGAGFAAGFDAGFASGFAADFVVSGFVAGAGAATATTDASASPSSVNEKRFMTGSPWDMSRRSESGAEPVGVGREQLRPRLDKRRDATKRAVERSPPPGVNGDRPERPRARVERGSNAPRAEPVGVGREQLRPRLDKRRDATKRAVERSPPPGVNGDRPERPRARVERGSNAPRAA